MTTEAMCECVECGCPVREGGLYEGLCFSCEEERREDEAECEDDWGDDY